MPHEVLNIKYKNGSNVIEIQFEPNYNAYPCLRYAPAEIEYSDKRKSYILTFKNSIVLKRYFKIY